MKSITSLKPESVWNHFSKLTEIPHPSGYCKEIADYVENFGKSLGLETLRDKIGNVCIRKPATKGYENRPTVVLQSHLDMVPQANDETFDFTRRPIETVIDGGWVKAAGTTLGADNGIGVAATMAVLEATDLKHGAIEGIFTVDEETGMYGANEIRAGFINGKIMLNLDSELDGDIYIGCAGGEDINARIKYVEEIFNPAANDVVVKIVLSGLKGGHSGVDIHLGRGNANKLAARLLVQLTDKFDIKLISLNGGNMRNAIPREATAVFIVKEKYLEEVKKYVSEYRAVYIKEFDNIEEADKLKLQYTSEEEKSVKIIPADVQRKFLNALNGCPNGVVNMFAKIPDTVETSVNMSIVKAGAGVIDVQFLARSSSESKKKAICASVASAFYNAGGEVEFGNSYQGWDPDYDSPVLKVMEHVFEKKRGAKPSVKVMHAGLECGIILANVPGLDTVSFGPTIKHPHSPDEKVEIESVQGFWNLLTDTLAAI